MDPRHEELLRRLALNDESVIDSALHLHLTDTATSALGAKSSALVRLAALIALRASAASYEWSVAAALAAGATDDEVVGVLVSVAPVVGVARVNRASANVATALGHDVDLVNRE